MTSDNLNTENNTTFAMIPTWLLKSGISANSIMLYGILWSYANRETGECFPSRARLANDMDCSKDTVRRAMKELEKIGAVLISQRDNGSTLQYTLIFSNPNETHTSNRLHESKQGDSTEATPEVAQEQPITITKELNPFEQDIVFTQKASRNDIWNALEQIMGYKPSSPSERGNWGKVVKQLVEMEVGPADMIERAMAYRKRWPNIDLTVNALLKHWDFVMTEQQDEFKTRMKQIDNALGKGDD